MAYLSLDWLIDHRGIGRATSSVIVERLAAPNLHRIERHADVHHFSNFADVDRQTLPFSTQSMQI
ncbi:hypothetical protein [Methylobacterium sp. WL6]|uniref:hypothetical protein n=1 Tax=Methylobacterium sp. WL6 TaxID=2603901 RepID=UPI0011C95D55|nr:hypothetical protein [Methylobacterium sp. WL6]TXN70481.1 hypothetical protein FV230_10535 [Methylobacterium sp. WL6]